MRLFLSLFLALTSSLNTLAQKGINFTQAPINAIFSTAKRVDKPVFVEVYSPDCHVCQSFMPTLEDSNVGKSYNSKFVSTRLDRDQTTTRNWLQSKHYIVPTLPLFLYFNQNGELIHFAMSQNTTDEVIRHANNAVSPTVRSENWKQRFQAGERSPDFLIDLGMLSRVVCDTNTNIAAMEAYAAQQPATTHANQNNWLVLQKLIIDMNNPLAKSLVNNIELYKQQYGQPAVDVAENILMSSLYSSRGLHYSPAQIQQVYAGLVQIGIDSKMASLRTMLPEVNAYFKLGQVNQAAERMNSHIAHSLSVPEHLYVARLFNRSSPDTTDVPSLTKWVQKALFLKTTATEQADLYYEQAEAYRRAGRTPEAKQAAQRALDLAHTAQIDTKRNMEQINKLK